MMKLSSIAIAVALVWAGSAQAADQHGHAAGADHGALANACDAAGVLSHISGRFAWAERRTWKRGFVMERLENPRPNTHPYAAPGLIHRDYCVAAAVMTNGAVHTVYYAIEHGLGFAGIGRGVDFCVHGLDPWRVHDASCRTVR